MKKTIIISLLILFLLFLIAFPFFFKVKTECLTQYGKCPDDIYKSIESNNLSLSKTKNKLKSYFKNNHLVSNYSTQLKLPNILVINVILEKPSFVLMQKNSEKEFLINNTGVILGVTKDSSLPRVIDDVEIHDNDQKVGESDLFGLKLIEGVYQMYQIGTGEVANNTLVVELPNQIRVLFPLNGDRDLLLGSLRLVYTKITSDNSTQNYKEIDLRFKNPVIR